MTAASESGGARLCWCLLHGRLGNNLFQYAAASTLAPRGIILLDFSKTGTALTRHKIAREDFLRLGLPGVVVPPLLNRLAHRLTGRHLYQLGLLRRIGEAEWGRGERPSGAGVLLEGYFQAAATAGGAPQAFRSGLLSRLEKAAGVNAWWPDDGVVAVHVRRGDYLPHDARTVCGPEYFLEAMRRLRAMGAAERFVIFSDDPAWCGAHLGGPGVRLAPAELERDPVASLHAMALCRHQIISNSTFSWWAGWLNRNPDKIVVGPDRWDADGSEPLAPRRFSAYHTLSELRR